MPHNKVKACRKCEQCPKCNGSFKRVGRGEYCPDCRAWFIYNDYIWSLYYQDYVRPETVNQEMLEKEKELRRKKPKQEDLFNTDPQMELF